MILMIFISNCVKQISQDEIINTNLNTPFQLRVNQIAFIINENIKLEFLDVVQDSRCIPYHSGEIVQCKWEGEVTIKVRFIKNDKELEVFDLTIGGNKEYSTKNLDDYSIKLLKVNYLPKSIKTIKKSLYDVTLIVSKI